MVLRHLLTARIRRCADETMLYYSSTSFLALLIYVAHHCNAIIVSTIGLIYIFVYLRIVVGVRFTRNIDCFDNLKNDLKELSAL